MSNKIFFTYLRRGLVDIHQSLRIDNGMNDGSSRDKKIPLNLFDTRLKVILIFC